MENTVVIVLFFSQEGKLATFCCCDKTPWSKATYKRVDFGSWFKQARLHRTEGKEWHADRSRKLPNVFVHTQEAVRTNSK